MALRQDPYGNAFCPNCDSKLESSKGIAAMFGAMFLMDVITWILTAIFVGIGLLWTPAYIIAACIAGIGMFIALSKSKENDLVCRNCGREFASKEVGQL